MIKEHLLENQIFFKKMEYVFLLIKKIFKITALNLYINKKTRGYKSYVRGSNKTDNYKTLD